MSKPVTIIMIEDDEGHARLIERNIRRSGVNNEIVPFTNGTEAVHYLFGSDGTGLNHKGEALLILLDLNLPDMTGIDVLRRVKDNKYLKCSPVVVLTTTDDAQEIKRCYALGKGLRQAIEAWDSNQRVAIIASGGLSHFVIEEELDQHIIEGLKNKDESKLTDLPNIRFNSGTSEIRNWIVVAGAMADNGLEMNLIDYQPCYRSEAGTGCAMGFAEWV